MSRPRGFIAEWRPQARTRVLLTQVDAVLAEYAAYLPLTVRQIFYRLVGQFAYDKTEAAYERLCETLNRARRASLVPWDAVRDDGGVAYATTFWDDAAEYLEAVAAEARSLRVDRQEGQPTRLWLLCEAAGMAPMLAQAADPFGVPVSSNGGFDSVTSKYKLAERIVAADVPAEILHVGDFDPSGEHVFSALAEDVEAFVAGMSGIAPTFCRLAVLPEQIRELGLPGAPPKPGDRRSFSGVETVQAEAIPPNVLVQIVQDAIVCRQDAEATDRVHKAELDLRAELEAKLRGLLP